MKWYWQAFKKYATFSGRARRSEFWFFYLFQFLIFFICQSMLVVSALVVQNMSFGDMLVGIEAILIFLLFLATFIPSIAVIVRRLHDVGMSGWWLLVMPTIFSGGVATIVPLEDDEIAGLIFVFIFLFSLVLMIYLFVKLVSEGEKVTNRYGTNPKENDNIASFFE